MAESPQAGKFRRFRALSAADKQLLARAAWCLGAARLLMAVVPFRRLSKRIITAGTSIPLDPDVDLIERVGRAVSIAANHVPWRTDCLPRAIAGQMLLRHYGWPSTIHIGVERQGEAGIEGHAWLTCGRIVVIGGGALDRYTELGQLSQ